jgi:GntR family transcriptional regulator
MSARQLKVGDLPITPVNPNSPIPLYYQVEADLRDLLRSHHVVSGDLLPTEIELSKAYNVGRHTVRTALSRLANDNLISRKAGHGTVVRSPLDRRHFSLAQSFSSQMRELGLVPHSRVLQAQPSTVQPTDARPLLNSVGQPCLHLTRLRLGGDEPIGLQYSTIVTTRCPNLEQYDFATESLYDVLTNRYQLVIAQITHTISALAADKKQAEHLNIETRAPLLVVNTSAYLDDGVLIEFSVSYYRADKYEYTTRQTG